jgi:hypothetical protein
MPKPGIELELKDAMQLFQQHVRTGWPQSKKRETAPIVSRESYDMSDPTQRQQALQVLEETQNQNQSRQRKKKGSK